MREDYLPRIPEAFYRGIAFEEGAKTTSVADADTIRSLFPHQFGQGVLHGKEGPPCRPLRVGVVLSGGQAPGGHNVITGLFDALRGGTLFGFLGGPAGIVEGKFIELKRALIDPYRNQGGFHMLGSGRTKIETDEQLKASLDVCLHLQLDGLVIIGGDDSNTNAALLGEYFLTHGAKTAVVGVPKTIDGDLQNAHIPISFGFDTATKTYSEMIGNLCFDALSAKKYTHFVKLMGRSASHITLECALKTHPNIALIGEEILAKRLTLAAIVKEIATTLEKRQKEGKHYGVILVPEGLIEFIPEKASLIADLGLESDPHGNLQVSHINTEEVLMQKVAEELKQRGCGKFAPVSHFFGYEGRSGYPTNFDANYCYALGFVAAALLHHGKSGYMAGVTHLTEESHLWKAVGVPITSLLNMEERKGVKKPVIQKALVDLKGKPFQTFASKREAWALADAYQSPGPIQFTGPASLTDSPPLILL